MATDHDGPTGTRERDTAPAGADAAPTPTADPAVTVEVVPLDTLTPLTDNPRTHTSRGIDFLKASLGRVGAARSGVIDEERTILAGNGMQDAATHPPRDGPIQMPPPPRGRPRSGSGTSSGSMRMWSGAATARPPRTSTPCWVGPRRI